jgi:hypothetical protein
VQVVVLFAASLTVQVTVVTPIGKFAGALFETINDPAAVQLSKTIGLPSETVVVQFPVPSLDVLAVVMFAGQVIEGASSSVTVTFWVQVVVLFAASLTVQVTVVTPIGKFAGALFETINDPTAVQLSKTIGLPSETVVVQFPVPSLDVLAVVMFAGQVIEGGIVSVTVTV